MDNNIKVIQDKLMNNLERLDTSDENLSQEVARSNAVSQLANTYIKSCNLIIRIEETKANVRKEIGDVANEE